MTGRRAFIGGAMASALAGCEWSRAFRSPAVGNRLPGWCPGEYQVHFIYTGETWLGDVPAAVFEPCHVVLSVADGGESYTISCLGAMEDNFVVRAQFSERTA